MPKHVRVQLNGDVSERVMRFDDAAVKVDGAHNLTIKRNDEDEILAYFPAGSWHNFTTENAR